MSEGSTAYISPTAHYTGSVWYNNKMGAPGLSTARGQLYYNFVRPFDWLAASLTGGLSLENSLLQRHKLIDHLLTQKIESGEVTQVVEIAAGISPRGYRFRNKYPHLKYLETDLPGMINTRRQLAQQIPEMQQHLIELDALNDDYMTVLGKRLDQSQACAMITEGLIGYLNKPQAEQVWSRVFSFMSHFNSGTYYTDMHVAEHNQNVVVDLFKRGLALFVGNTIEWAFETDEEVINAMKKNGARAIVLHNPDDFITSLGLPRVKTSSVVRIACAEV